MPGGGESGQTSRQDTNLSQKTRGPEDGHLILILTKVLYSRKRIHMLWLSSSDGKGVINQSGSTGCVEKHRLCRARYKGYLHPNNLGAAFFQRSWYISNLEFGVPHESLGFYPLAPHVSPTEVYLPNKYVSWTEIHPLHHHWHLHMGKSQKETMRLAHRIWGNVA